MNRQANDAAARMAGIEPFHVMEVQDRALELEAQGRRIIHMEIGQPDFSAPPQVIEAAVDAVRHRPLGYTPALGIPELRREIARYYRERHGVEVSPERIAVTAGASGAFLLALATLVNPGDEWIMPDPCYPCSRHFVRLFEGRARTLPVDERQSYQLCAADVQRNWDARTRGVMIASPSNPTGTSVSAAELGAIIDCVRSHGGFTLVDEIYLGLSYEGSLATALALADDVFVVNSFSKYFNMTGWRLGWMVAPARYMREV
ncbi:MAG: aminotransferase class I/II-fold pyridoxal phosphate-dependent enzyme, partial [Betaproteobacteria bacterium]|nr:aminotransferase class I/II-fold pyridoxal phosphate-dependent enzyme [Betaproteobacteria bacterium]